MIEQATAARLREGMRTQIKGVPMPVIRRKLSSPTVIAPPSSDQRGMNLKAAANFAGVSVWQVRRWIREGELRPAIIGNKYIVDRVALDRLLDGLFAAAA
jgi:Helix-turn-helix domain